MSKTMTCGILAEHQMLHIYHRGGPSNHPGVGGRPEDSRQELKEQSPIPLNEIERRTRGKYRGGETEAICHLMIRVVVI